MPTQEPSKTPAWGSPNRFLPMLVLPVIAGIVILASSALGATDATPNEDPPTTVVVSSMQLITDGGGWILTTDGLKLTDDGGTSWNNITPPGLKPSSIKGVYFLDSESGWVVANGPTDASGLTPIVSWRTADSGKTWAPSAIADPSITYTLSLNGPAYPYFVDKEHGWAVVKTVSSSQFSNGDLYRTTDGGDSWKKQSIPLGEPAAFANEDDGVVVGGPSGSAWVTRDGGNSWTELEIQIPEGLTVTQTGYYPAAFFTRTNGILPAIFSNEETVLTFFSTSDGGASWTQTGGNMTTSSDHPASLLVPSAVDEDSLVTVASDGSEVRWSSDRGASWSVVSATGLPGGVVHLDFATKQTGWALGVSTECKEFKQNCSYTSQVYQTSDGGQSWVSLTLP
jgi:photosystem II stability/assembly factor-like uncharacterized protein